MPQTLAHRGFKANHPENTMGAFKGAAKAGAHGIETDIHMTKDQILVLSHVGNDEPRGRHSLSNREHLAGCNSEALFWQRREDQRLHLGLRQPAKDARSAA